MKANMQSNMNRIFIKKYFLFFSLFFLFGLSSFANDYLLSPVDGEWANQQPLIIDVPDGGAAYYSLTGDNPMKSGFAYDSPILLDMEGPVLLKIVVVKKDGQVIEEQASFSCGKSNAIGLDTLHQISVPIIELSENNPIVIDENAYFSFADNSEPYLKGREIDFLPNNDLEELLPLIIKQDEKMYRYMVQTCVSSDYEPVAKKNHSSTLSYPENQTLVEQNLSDCPLELAFHQWSTLEVKAPNNVYATLDNGNWQTGDFSISLDRETEHSIYWLKVPSENATQGDIDLPYGVVFFSRIPAKPAIVTEQHNERSSIKIALDSPDFDMALLQNHALGKNFSKKAKSFEIDTPDGHELISDIQFLCYYDGIAQGVLFVPVVVDKLPPKSPTIVPSVKGDFLRNDVNVSFVSDCDVYLYAQAVSLSDSEISKYADNTESEFSFRKSDAHLSLSKMAICKAENEKAVLYSLATYAKDKAGNISECSYYKVLIDSTNYYLSQDAKIKTLLQDGSASNPFSSFSQLKSAMEKGSAVKVHLSGNFVCDEPIEIIDGNCSFVSKTGSRISVNSNLFMHLDNSVVSMENCIIEQSFSNESDDFVQVNLFEVDNSSLSLKNCELVSVTNKSSSLFVLQNSNLTVDTSGVSLQTSDYGSLYNAVNSTMECHSVRNSLTSTIASCISINSGKCNLFDSNFQVNGNSVKFYELFDTEYSMKNNVFLYKNSSKNMFSTDVFCKKILYENNASRSF